MKTGYFTHELEQEFNELLDETHEPIVICGMTYYPGRVFQHIDQIAYRECFLDYIDGRYKEDPTGKFDYIAYDADEELANEAEAEDYDQSIGWQAYDVYDLGVTFTRDNE